MKTELSSSKLTFLTGDFKMKINLRINSSNSTHTKITMFIDEKNCGALTLGSEDVKKFFDILANGVSNRDSFEVRVK
jgi:hypothetical protein